MGHFVCVLERLYDLGNIAAVMRSAEAFGEPNLPPRATAKNLARAQEDIISKME